MATSSSSSSSSSSSQLSPLDVFGRVRLVDTYDRKQPWSSALTIRFVFVEFIGTAVLVAMSCGVDMASQHVAGVSGTPGFVQDKSPGRILVTSIGNGFAYAAIMFFAMSFIGRVRYRLLPDMFAPLREGGKSTVFVRANNTKGWTEGVVDRSSADGKVVIVRILRTTAIREVPREDVRVRLRRGDVARTKEEDERVQIMSDEPSSICNNTYDVQYYDGRHGKVSMWDLRVSSRDEYIVGHFNPAITYAATWIGDVHPDKALAYVCAQMMGGFVGAAFVKAAVPGFGDNGQGLNVPEEGVSNLRALSAEIAFTTILTLVSLTVFVSPIESPVSFPHPFYKEAAPFLLGIVSVAIYVAGSVTTGAPVNIARTVSAALVNGTVQSLWIYVLASWIGSILAVVVWACTFSGWRGGCDFTEWTSLPKRELLSYLFLRIFGMSP